jgi:quinol monooxygenase YgiN
MSEHVFVVSEWLAKAGHDQELWIQTKKIMALTKEKEKGCLSARATRQITHPGKIHHRINARICRHPCI